MVSIRKGNTNRSIETRTENDLTNRIIKTKIGEIRRGIIKANTGTRTSIGIVPVLLRTRTSMMVAIIKIKTRIKRVLRLVRSTRVAVHPVRIRIRTRAGTRNIITNRARARAPKTKTGKIRRNVSYKILI